MTTATLECAIELVVGNRKDLADFGLEFRLIETSNEYGEAWKERQLICYNNNSKLMNDYVGKQPNRPTRFVGNAKKRHFTRSRVRKMANSFRVYSIVCYE